MAIRLNADGEKLSRSSSVINYNAAYTVMAWVRIANLRAWADIFTISNNGESNYDQLCLNGAGTAFLLESIGANSGNVTGSAAAAATWYHLAMVRSSASDLRVYLNGVQDMVVSPNQAGRTASTHLYFGDSHVTEWNDASYAAAKAWDANLSVAEIAQEMRQYLPHRTANIHGFWPGLSHTDVIDYSGNGRDLTASGTLTTEDGPPIPWRMGSRRANYVPSVGGGGTPYFQSLTASLTTAAALVRQTSTFKAGTLVSSAAVIKQARPSKAGTLTSAGAIVKQTQTAKAGTLTSAGALAGVKTALLSLAATLSSSATLVRRTGKIAAAMLVSSAAVVKRPARALTGSVSSLATLAAVKTALLSLSATLTSAADLSRRTNKSVASVTAPTGSLTKRTARALSGSLSPAGAIASVKAALKSLAGTVSASTTLMRLPGKGVSGTVATAGTLSRRTSRELTGTLALGGSLVKRTARSLSGVLSFLGTLVGIGGGAVPTLGRVITPRVRYAVRARTVTPASLSKDLRSAVIARRLRYVDGTP